MPTDPSILLQGVPPQDPLAQYGKVLALKNALQQGQVGQQQLQEGNINLQQKQQLLQDQQTFSAVMGDPAVGGDINKALPILSKKTSPQFYIPLSKSLLDNGKTLAETADLQSKATKVTQEASEATQSAVSEMLQGALDDGGDANALGAHAAVLKAMRPDLTAKIDPLLAQVYNAPDHDAAARQLIAFGITQATKAKKATALEQTAGANQKQAEADKSNFELDLQRGAFNGTGDAAIRKRFEGNPAALQQALDAWHQSLPAGVKAATDEVNKVYDNTIGAPGRAAATVTAETPAKVAQGRAMIPVQAQAAGAEENARIPGRVAGAVQEQRALAKDSPDAFSGITSQTARNQAQNEADKVYKDYTDKASQTQSFLDSVNAARTNPAIAATIPMQEVRQFINRVNAQELSAVSAGVGGILQRADTWLEKNTIGTPPKWLLDDVSQIAGIQLQAAQRGFEAGKDRLKMRGVDVTKLPAPSTAATGQVAGSGAPIALKDGTFLTPHDDKSALKFRQDHPELIK